MLIIRTAEALARALSLQTLLQAQAERLADFAFEELAMIAIVQPGDDLDAINTSIGWSLLDSTGSFSRSVELIVRQGGWYEVTFILSDDAYGLILNVPISEGTNSELLKACERALTEFQTTDTT